MMALPPGHLDVAHVLLENDTAVNLRNNNGWMSLKIASECGHLDITGTLIQSGAPVLAWQRRLDSLRPCVAVSMS